MRKVFVGLAVFGLLAGAACSSDGGKKDGKPSPTSPAGPAAATIKASGTTWDPQEVSIKTGDVVEWSVDGSIVHDLKGDEGVSHKAASNFKQTHRYGKPGTYAFQCTIHPGMNGTVTVAP
jgi:plastocyanin